MKTSASSQSKPANQLTDGKLQYATSIFHTLFLVNFQFLSPFVQREFQYHEDERDILELRRPLAPGISEPIVRSKHPQVNFL